MMQFFTSGIIRIVLVCGITILLGISCKQSKPEKHLSEDNASWEYLKQVDIPQWYEDAKFGIFIHWGPYSVPGWSDGNSYAEWYSTLMYTSPSFNQYHTKHYGRPEEFGYKDFIPLFKAENYNAEEWAEILKKSGAKYVIPTAEHHDGFAMWDTELTTWNSVDKGPKIDFIETLGDAVRKTGLKYGISYHRERHWSFFTDSRNTYKENPQPFDAIKQEIATHPEAALLYGPFGLTEEFIKDYKQRFLELCSKYQPDFMWIDDAPSNSHFPDAPAVKKFMDTCQREMIAAYVAMSKDWNKQVYWNNKRWKRSNYPQGAGVDEKDYLRMDSIPPVKWQSSGGMANSYGYDRTEEFAEKYKTSEQLVEILIDVVSKNGNFLLDIGPKPDGTFTDLQKSRLEGIGNWLSINGEAIYSTRPWFIYGYENVRFTKKDNTLYIILLDKPEKEILIQNTGLSKESDIASIQLLGSDIQLNWSLEKPLTIIAPKDYTEAYAYVFKVNYKGGVNIKGEQLK